MAKGLRSTVKRRNRATLRRTVFGPAHDARTERLSAKLQELASQPRPVNKGDEGDEGMELDATKQSEDNAFTKDGDQIEDMDIDLGSKAMKSKGKSSSQNKRSNGIRKMSRRKEKNLSTFPKYRLKRHQKPSTKQKK